MRQMVGAILLVMVVVAGCASTQEAKSVEKSGFLGDYSLLKEGQRSTFNLDESEGLSAQGCVRRGSAAVGGVVVVEA
jgi:hypothetical protein